MNARSFLISIPLLLSATGASFASEVGFKAELQRFSCGYYTNTTGQFDIDYVNKSLPAGSSVRVLYGWETRSYDPTTLTPEHERWQTLRPGAPGEAPPLSVEMRETAPVTWHSSLEEVLHSRGSSQPVLDGMDLIIEIVAGDGSTMVDRGSEDSAGYYRISWSEFYDGIPCGRWFAPALAVETVP